VAIPWRTENKMRIRGSVCAATGLALVLQLCTAGATEFTFDASEFARKPYELGGYLEYRHDDFRLNRDGAFYALANQGPDGPSTLARNAAALKLEGNYRYRTVGVRARTHLEYSKADGTSEHIARFDELAGSWKPGPDLTAELGKIALKWGKGYAWNPVAFVERLKDPNDPELAREGFWMATADWVKTFEGALKTVAFTPVVVPTGSDVNSDFGRTGHTNIAAKLYLLWYDTDIDFAYLSGGSRPSRFGFDFSRNITSNLEVHGEWARISDAQRRTITAAGVPGIVRGKADSYLVGARYLTANDTTFIAEYYRNEAGYTQSEMENFFAFVDNAFGQPRSGPADELVRRASAAAQGGYARAQPMQRYFYLRVSQKDPFDILYFTPALTSIVNLSDGSFSVSPEITYTGVTNVELRLRFFALGGGDRTDFGEKLNRRRVELRARLYF
jgi:hypothetical protein